MGWRDYLALQEATGVDYVDKVDKATPVDPHNPLNPHNPPGVISENVPVRAESRGAADRWMVVQDGKRIERYFSESLTSAEVLARVGGESAEAVIDARRLATFEEESELTHLLAAVAAQGGFTAEEQAEALANALRDAANALRCFRALLNEGCA